MNSRTRFLNSAWQVAVLAILVTGVTVFVGLSGNLLIARVATIALITGILVIGMQVFVGNSGIVSFGHVAFFAVGAYISAWLTIPEAARLRQFPALPDWLPTLGLPAALLVASLVAAASAMVVGVPLMRLRGITASVATLALLLIVQIVASNWTDVTGGQQSVMGVPQDVSLWTVLGGMVISLAVAGIYQITPWCRRLRSSREDEIASVAIGVSVAKERIIALAISAGVSGFAGALWAHVIGPFSAASFSLELTFISVAMLIVGGMFSLTGAVVGVVVISVLGELPRHIDFLPAGSTPLIVSLVMLGVLLLRPAGIMGSREVPTLGELRRIRYRRPEKNVMIGD